MEQNNLLVTIADKNYIEQAKQVFSGAYFNAGWDGDFMLLTSNDVPEEKLKWFRSHGIIVNEKEPLFKNEVGGYNPILTHKFYLFTPEFKKWDVVIYIDADTIIRKSLERLKRTKKFSAVKNCCTFKIKDEIINKEDLVKRGLSAEEFIDKIEILKKICNLNKPAFSAGFFAFNTGIIKGNRLKEKLICLISKYDKISKWGEQLEFNLAFPDWRKISPIYNFYIIENKNKTKLKNKEIRPIILHITGRLKPWDKQSYFYEEWLNNLRKADGVNTKHKLKRKKNSKKCKFFHSVYLDSRIFLFNTIFFLDEKIGKIGLIIKKISPKTYYFLKKFKKIS